MMPMNLTEFEEQCAELKNSIAHLSLSTLCMCLCIAESNNEYLYFFASRVVSFVFTLMEVSQSHGWVPHVLREKKYSLVFCPRPVPLPSLPKTVCALT